MNKRKWGCGLILVLLATPLVCLSLLAAWQYLRPQPRPRTEALFNGITYALEVRNTHREMVIHVIRIDLQTAGLRLLVTPGEQDRDLPLDARTTSGFLSDFDLQLAVNGDGFEPWVSNNFFSYYPHQDDPVDVIGFAASEGVIYSEAHQDEPTLYFSQNNKARFDRPFPNVYNAISGNLMLVKNGRILVNSGDSIAPRTAIGLNRSEKELIIVVVDGRQPGYSMGAKLSELAELMVELGAHDAMNLDGGGSSTLVSENRLGLPDILNNPIDRNIPGLERPVGNHLGVYAKRNQ